VVRGPRHFLTAQAVEDRFLYEFIIGDHEELRILEFDTEEGAYPEDALEGKLLLVEKDQMELPILLREEHSHWYSKRHDVILLRAPKYQGRRIGYIVSQNETYVIPFQLQDVTLDAVVRLMYTCDQLLLGQSSVLNILGRLRRNNTST
jgi:hypothetical protein